MTAIAKTAHSQMGGTVKTYRWNWQGQPVTVTYEVQGIGQPVLLLPAFSTVSSRSEMAGLAERLSGEFQVFALDWLGFGQSDRPALPYQPALYRQLLQDFVNSTVAQPVAVIAAGHAAGYVMQLAQQAPPLWSKIALIAPTWRGPLPTMGAPIPVAAAVKQLVRSPLLGQFLYYLNTRPSFLQWMYRRHVYVDATKLTPAFIQQKYQTTQQPGARFAPAAFVTGGLDPLQSRDEFLALFQSLEVPVWVAIAEQSPPKSKAEMEALSGLPPVQIHRMAGTLGMSEEFAAEVANAVLPFLRV